MRTISQIRESIAPELDQLNERMMASLDSSNSLMNQVISNYLKTKGKQLRPMLVILTAKIFGSVTDKVIAAAASVEMLHNASLIHDDVVDDSATRHNRPTINAIWDNHIAVLVGDYFVSTALREAISTGDLRVIETIGRLGQLLSLGEMDQICNARFHTLDEESYFRVISHKTASLFVSCVETGCYVVGTDNASLEQMKRFAELFGLCFQIRDDIYDYFEDTAVGKPTGNDLREGKITLPLLYALDQDDVRKGLMTELSQKEQLTAEDIATLIAYAKEKGGIEYAFATIRHMADKAVAILDTLPQCAATDALRNLTEAIAE